MSIILSAAALPATALVTQAVSIDTGLWTGIALCAALIARHAHSRAPVVTVLSLATAMLLTSLALVAA